MPNNVSATWNGATADWNTPADWSTDTVPNNATTTALLVGSGGYTVTVSNAEAFTVGSLSSTDASAILEVTGGAQLTFSGSASNLGEVQLNTGATTSLSGTFTNSGTLDVDAFSNLTALDAGGSTLAIGETLANSGTVNIGNTGISSATTVTAAGLLNAGTINLQGTLPGSTLKQTTLDITGAAPAALGNVNIEGDVQLEFASGAVSGIAAGTALSISVDPTPISLDPGNVSGTFTNSGTLDVDAFSNLTALDAGGSTLAIGETLANSGTVNIGNTGISSATTVTAAGLLNAGTINLQGTLPGSTLKQTTLDVTGAAPAALGNVNIEGDVQLEFASGAVSGIAAGTALSISVDPTPISLDPGNVSGTFTNSGTLDVDAFSNLTALDAGGSTLAIGETLANSGTVNIGNTGISSATTVTAAGLLNAGTINLQGTLPGSTLKQTTLDITGAAPAALGNVNIEGDVQLEFASGAVSGIAAGTALSISVDPTPISLDPGNVSGTFTNSGTLDVDAFSNLTALDAGGSTLAIGETLANSGTVNIGNTGISSATTVTAAGLLNAGTINLQGTLPGSTLKQTTLDVTGAAPAALGNVNIEGDVQLEFASGAVSGIAAGTALSISVDPTPISLDPGNVSGTFTNSGTLDVDAFSNLTALDAGGSTLAIGETLANSGTVNIGNTGISSATTVTAAGLLNAGTINLQGTLPGSTLKQTTLDITGAAPAALGNVNIEGDVQLEFASGAVSGIAAGTALSISVDPTPISLDPGNVSGTFTNSGTLDVDAFSNLTALDAGGSTLAIGETLANSGTVNIGNTGISSATTVTAAGLLNAGTINLQGTLPGSTLKQTTLDITGAAPAALGNVNIEGDVQLEFASGAVSGIAAGTALSISVDPTPISLDPGNVSGTFTNSGTLDVDAFSNLTALDAGGSTLAIGETLANSGTVNIGNTGISSATTVTAAGLLNAGTINLQGTLPGSTLKQTTLDVTGAAPAALGNVNIEGDVQLEFASGAVSGIAAGTALSISVDPTPISLDPGNVSGTFTNSGTLDVDAFSNLTTLDAGGSTLAIGETLANSGTVNIGNTGISSATTVTAAGLLNAGTINLQGTLPGSTLKQTTLDITGAAPAALGNVNIEGDVQLEFASGAVSGIAAGTALSISVDPTPISLDPGNVSGTFTNSGTLDVDAFSNLTALDAGGSTLAIGETLANSGTVNIGNTGISSATTVTAAGLLNAGTINLQGTLPGSTLKQTTLDITGAAPAALGNVNIEGDVQLEFASGAVSGIAAGTALSISVDPTPISLDPGNVSGTFTNSGTLDVDAFSNLTALDAGGSTLAIGETLANSGTVNIGNTGISSATTVTAAGLLNAGTINLQGTLPGSTLKQTTLDALGGGTNQGQIQLSGDAVLNGGTLVTENGGILLVGSGAEDNGGFIGSYGTETIQSRGIASATAVNGGTEIVLSGGTASATDVKSGGVLLLSGGSTVGTVTEGGGTFELFGGAVIGGATVVSSGGVVEIGSDYTLSNGTPIVGVSGGIAGGVTVAVLSGGSASGLVVGSGGLEAVSSGGMASGTVVASGGLLEVFVGGSATATQVQSGGALIELPGGSATGTAISAGGAVVSSGAVLLSGTQIISGPSATLIDTSAGSNETELVLPGGTTISTSVGNGGQEFVYAGGVASLTTVSSGGAETVSSGGVTSGTQVQSGGTLELFHSAVISGTTTIASGGTLAVGSGYELLSAAPSGGIAGGVTVAVLSGGSASGTVVGAGGAEIVSSGGVASVTVVKPGGSVTVGAFGVAVGTTISSGGAQSVQGLGSANNTVVAAGGTEIVSGGGVAVGTVVEGGGEQEVLSGGLALDTTVESGGLQAIVSGGFASNTLVENGGSQTVVGGTVSITTVSGGGAQTIGFGGIAISAAIEENSTQFVSSGGVASQTLVGDPSKEIVSVGATTVSSILSNGGEENLQGTASHSIVEAGGVMAVLAGGLAIGTVVAGGAQVVSSGGVATGTIISDGVLELQSGSIVSGAIAFAGSGTLQIDVGVAIPSNVISGFGPGDTIDLRGVAPGTGGAALAAGNVLQITENSTLYSLTLDPGEAFLPNATFPLMSDGSGGVDITISETIAAGQSFAVSAGRYTAGITIAGGGSESVLSGGLASDSFVENGGHLLIDAGGATSGTVLDGSAVEDVFGSASGTVVGGSDVQLVEAGGTAAGTIVSGGTQVVLSGGVATGTVIRGGVLELQSGSIVSGVIGFAGGGALQIDAGASMPTNVISGFGPGDTIDLRGVALSNGGSVLSAGNVLTVTENGTVDKLTLDPNETFLDATFHLSSDGSGGIDVTVGEVVSAGQTATVSAGSYAAGIIISSGGSESVLSGGVASGSFVENGGHLLVGTGGMTTGTVLDGSGIEDVSGSASGTIVSGGDVQLVEAGGVAIGTTALIGGSELVSSGGVASNTLISGGALMLQSGGVVGGAISFAGSGGVLRVDAGAAIPANTISGFGASDVIDLVGLAFGGGGSAVLTSGNVLQVTEGSQSDTLQLDPNASYANAVFQLASDGSGGTDVSEILGTAPPFALDDNPLSLTQGASATIGPSLLRFGDSDTTAAGITYTVTSGPSDGTLLLNGSPTTSFTGTEVNSNQLSYQETAPGATADSFAFTVSDPYGNSTPTQTFQFQIVSTVPPFEVDNNPLSLAQGATATIGPTLLRYGDIATTAAQVLYTITSGPQDGTLLLNGSPATSFTGAEVNANQLSYHETAAGAAADSFAFTVSDPYGNTTPTQTFAIGITPTVPPFALDDNPLSLTQGASATIGPSLLRFGDSDTTAAGITYTVTSGPSDGTLLLNGSPATSFTGAEVNAGDLSYQETTPGATADSFAFTVSDPYGNTTAIQTFQFQIVSTVPPFEVDNNPLSLAQGATAAIGPTLLRYGDIATTAAQVLYTITSGPQDGTLLLNGSPATSFTGAEVNANQLSYHETAAGAAADSFAFTVSDPYGNTTPTQTFAIGITPTVPPFALDDNPLSLTQGTTATITPSLLRFGASDTTAAGITYTVTSGPSDGTLLLNGSPATSFTGAEVNAGDLSYQETTPGATADSFAFTVSDPYGNTTAIQTFQFQIVSTVPPFEVDNNPLSLAQGATATIGPTLLRYGDIATTAAQVLYTITSGPQDGTLLLNGSPATSFTGAEVNANQLSYHETAAGAASDSFAFTVSDPYGNTTPTQTFAIGITPTVPPFALDDNPLSLTQGASATIGPSLLRFGDSDTTAAGITYTVTSGPSDGTLLLNGSPATSFTGAEVNAGDLSYQETTPGATADSFAFTVSDPYGNTTAIQTFQFQIVSTVPPFEVDNNPLSLAQGATAAIGPTLLRYGDIATTAAQVLYTITSGPSDGTLLLNGSPTTSFTGAEVNANQLSYHETAAGAASDSFAFTVSDPYGNSTPTQHFQINI